jgi:hypothetical protein
MNASLTRKTHRRGVVTILGAVVVTVVCLSYATVALNRTDDSRNSAALAIQRAQILAAAEGAQVALHRRLWKAGDAPLTIGNCRVEYPAAESPLVVVLQGKPPAGSVSPPVLQRRLYTVFPSGPGTPTRIQEQTSRP